VHILHNSIIFCYKCFLVINLVYFDLKVHTLQSGECVPPGSWETSLLMCDGIQTMSHNLKALTDLSEMQEKLLKDAESLEQQIQVRTV
jgi:hypothetical protein